MDATRVAGALIGSFILLTVLLQARYDKPGFPKVTPGDRKKNPNEYQGRVVQVESTLAADLVASVRTRVPRFFLRLAEADGLGVTSYTPPPAVSKGPGPDHRDVPL